MKQAYEYISSQKQFTINHYSSLVMVVHYLREAVHCISP